MKTYRYLALAVAFIACDSPDPSGVIDAANTESQFAPHAAYSGSMLNNSIISMVRAFTIASDGTIYQPVITYTLCFTSSQAIPDHPPIFKETGCADSHVYELMDGGTVTLEIEVDGVDYALGWVPGDLSRKLRFEEVTSTGTVTATATPNGGCSFTRWSNHDHTGDSYTSFDPVLVQSGATVDMEFFAFFECDTGGGPGGW